MFNYYIFKLSLLNLYGCHHELLSPRELSMARQIADSLHSKSRKNKRKTRCSLKISISYLINGTQLSKLVKDTYSHFGNESAICRAIDSSRGLSNSWWQLSNCMVFISIQVSVKAGIKYQKKLSGNRRSTKLSFHTTIKLRFSGSDTQFKLLFNCSFFRRCFSLIRVGVYVQLLYFQVIAS
jgi:hypothetical protein